MEGKTAQWSWSNSFLDLFTQLTASILTSLSLLSPLMETTLFIVHRVSPEGVPLQDFLNSLPVSSLWQVLGNSTR